MATRAPRSKRAAMADPLAPEPQKPLQQELAPTPDDPTAKPARLVVVYAQIEEGLRLMREKHGGVLTAKPVVTAENVATVKASLKEMVTFRTTLEAVRKAEKEDSLRYGQKVDAEAKRIQQIADPIEATYRDALTTWENAEQDRKDAILQRIATLRNTPQQAIGKSIEQLEQISEGIRTFPLAELQEYREQGATAQFAAQQSVDALLKQAKDAAEEKRLNEERQLEAARVAGIRRRIDAIRNDATTARAARRAVTLKALVDRFEAANSTLTVETFAELLDEATQVRDAELKALRQLLADKVASEAAAARLAELEATVKALTPPPTAAPTPAPTAAPTVDASNVAFPPVEGGELNEFVTYEDSGLTVTEVGTAPAPSVARTTRTLHGDQAYGPGGPGGMGYEVGRRAPEERGPAVLYGAVKFAGESKAFGVATIDTAAPAPTAMPAAAQQLADIEDAAIVRMVAEHYDVSEAAALARLACLDFASLTASITNGDTPQ